MDTTDVAAIRAITDELEIRNTLARLAHLADTLPMDDIDEYVSIFTEDAAWAVLASGPLPAQERHGRAEILAAARDRRETGVQGPGSNRRHVISTTAIELEAADRALARSYWQLIEETDAERPVIGGIGEYRDTFVRAPDGWKLARREIIFG